MRFLIDMNLSPDWVGFFAQQEIEAIHWSSVGLPNAADSELMEYARQSGFIVFTQDLDFSAMLAVERVNAPSVVQLRVQDSMPQAVGAKVMLALTLTAEQLMAGALVTIDLRQHRLRMLPLR